jgi:hypothetical protein
VTSRAPPHPPRVGGRWALLLTVLAAGSARAYRPFDQTDADVAELHVIELELGPAQLQSAAGRTSLVPTFIFNLGVLPSWELVVEGLGSGIVIGSGQPGDVPQLEVGISMKGVVRQGSLQGAEGPSVAIEPQLLLPATAGPSGFGVAAGLIVSQRWPALTLHLNLVPAWSRAHRFAALAGVIVEGPSAWVVRPVAETYVEAERGEPSATVSGLAGLIWRVSSGVAADAALRVATVSGTGVLEVRLGLTWDLPL